MILMGWRSRIGILENTGSIKHVNDMQTVKIMEINYSKHPDLFSMSVMHRNTCTYTPGHTIREVTNGSSRLEGSGYRHYATSHCKLGVTFPYAGLFMALPTWSPDKCLAIITSETKAGLLAKENGPPLPSCL